MQHGELVELIKEILLADHSGRPEDIADAIMQRFILLRQGLPIREQVWRQLDYLRDEIGCLRSNDPLKKLFEIVELLAKS